MLNLQSLLCRQCTGINTIKHFKNMSFLSSINHMNGKVCRLQITGYRFGGPITAAWKSFTTEVKMKVKDKYIFSPCLYWMPFCVPRIKRKSVFISFVNCCWYLGICWKDRSLLQAQDALQTCRGRPHAKKDGKFLPGHTDQRSRSKEQTDV